METFCPGVNQLWSPANSQLSPSITLISPLLTSTPFQSCLDYIVTDKNKNMLSFLDKKKNIIIENDLVFIQRQLCLGKYGDQELRMLRGCQILYCNLRIKCIHALRPRLLHMSVVTPGSPWHINPHDFIWINRELKQKLGSYHANTSSEEVSGPHSKQIAAASKLYPHRNHRALVPSVSSGGCGNFFLRSQRRSQKPRKSGYPKKESLR